MVVADTDVVSYLFKRHLLAQAYSDLLVGHSVMISFMTVAEIEYGMESDGWGQNRREAMRSYLEGRFSTVYPDALAVKIWAEIVAGCERKGRSISHSDAWIAATAMRLGAPLVTHNATDYSAVGALTVLSHSG